MDSPGHPSGSVLQARSRSNRATLHFFPHTSVGSAIGQSQMGHFDAKAAVEIAGIAEHVLKLPLVAGVIQQEHAAHGLCTFSLDADVGIFEPDLVPGSQRKAPVCWEIQVVADEPGHCPESGGPEPRARGSLCDLEQHLRFVEAVQLVNEVGRFPPQSRPVLLVLRVHAHELLEAVLLLVLQNCATIPPQVDHAVAPVLLRLKHLVLLNRRPSGENLQLPDLRVVGEVRVMQIDPHRALVGLHEAHGVLGLSLNAGNIVEVGQAHDQALGTVDDHRLAGEVGRLPGPQGEAPVLRETPVASGVVGYGSSPRGPKRYQVGLGRLEQHRPNAVCVAIIHQLLRNLAVAPLHDVEIAHLHQLLGPGELRGLDALFGEIALARLLGELLVFPIRRQ
mmetsp:Transcript_62803/g.149994  ORF Transcript_62803/g.149994 Transcript_62803/m.149994 type:complete len:392 (-) Transcript_62803:1074-2249(-)